MEAVIFIGAQASGKSTFFLRQFSDTHVRINLDMLKTRHREAILLRACIEMKQPFVIDNTNPHPDDRARYIGPARAGGFRVRGFYFQSRLGDLIQRNDRRPQGKKIPERGIRATHSRMVLPRWDEGFDELNYVEIDSENNFSVSEWVDEV